MQRCQRVSLALMVATLILVGSGGAQGRLLRGAGVLPALHQGAGPLATSGSGSLSRALLKQDKSDGAAGGDQSPRGLPVPRAVATVSGRSGGPRSYGYTSAYTTAGGQNQPINFSDSWANAPGAWPAPNAGGFGGGASYAQAAAFAQGGYGGYGGYNRG